MIFADDMHPYTREKRAVTYFSLTSIIFLLIVGIDYMSRLYSPPFRTYWDVPYVGSAFFIAPIFLILDTIIYQIVVIPCCVKSTAKRCIRYMITRITQFALIVFGLISLTSGIYVQGQYNGGVSNLFFLFHEVVFGLIVWPFFGKLLVLYIGFINIPIGGKTCCGTFYLCGAWKYEKETLESSTNADCCLETCCALCC